MAKKKATRRKTNGKPRRKKAKASTPAATPAVAAPAAPAKTSDQIDRDLVRAGLQNRRDGKPVTRDQLSAIRRFEKAEEERLRWEHYRSIPKKHWMEMSGRQHRTINEQADRYSFPLTGPTIDLVNFVHRFHAFLADNSAALNKEDSLLSGPTTQSLERLRRVQAELKEMERDERRGTLRPADDVTKVYTTIQEILRGAFEEIVEQFGAEAQEILAAAVAECDVAMDSFTKQKDR